jgi:hypothetical protein
VLDPLRCVGQPPPPEDQLSADQLCDGIIDLLSRKFRNGADQFVGKVSADGRPDLRHLARLSKAIKACKERSVKCRRDRQ